MVSKFRAFTVLCIKDFMALSFRVSGVTSGVVLSIVVHSVRLPGFFHSRVLTRESVNLRKLLWRLMFPLEDAGSCLH